MHPSNILEAHHLTVDFPASTGGFTRVVQGLSFEVPKGKTVAIVGESGSGKTVTALALTRLLGKNAVLQGDVWCNHQALWRLSPRALNQVRRKTIAYIFQEPAASLNPSLTIGYQVAEVIALNAPRVKNRKAQAIAALEAVGIEEAPARYHAYPHQFSGGMQQRVMIAMAMACQPQLLIADEPTTALDVTTQKKILDLLKRIQAASGLSILLVTHNFGIVAGFADSVLVMRQGSIVEAGTPQQILNYPQQPYTQALISCIPRLGHADSPGSPCNRSCL